MDAYGSAWEFRNILHWWVSAQLTSWRSKSIQMGGSRGLCGFKRNRRLNCALIFDVQQSNAFVKCSVVISRYQHSVQVQVKRFPGLFAIIFGWTLFYSILKLSASANISRSLSLLHQRKFQLFLTYLFGGSSKLDIQCTLIRVHIFAGFHRGC